MLPYKYYTWLPLLLLYTVWLNMCSRMPPGSGNGTFTPTSVKYRGVNWVAGDSVTSTQIAALKQANIQWIAQTPFGWQPAYNKPEVRLNKSFNKHYWGESDAGLVHTTQLARQAGIKTLLKPHLWLMDRSGKWLGDIEMENATDWQAWFRNYTTFITHYARLAEENQIEALCIGTELMKPAITHEKEWRQLIREIRKIYSGELTYAANWHLEYEQIKFWDDLDFIGVQGYFPLTKKKHPTLNELKSGWQSYLTDLEKIAYQYQKPVVFTEAGYKSTPDAAIEPWKWPDRDEQAPSTESDETQALCYEALYQTLWHRPWFGGTFIWKWYPQVREHRRDHRDFTPQHKPAEKIMTSWYGKEEKNLVK